MTGAPSIPWQSLTPHHRDGAPLTIDELAKIASFVLGFAIDFRGRPRRDVESMERAARLTATAYLASAAAIGRGFAAIELRHGDFEVIDYGGIDWQDLHAALRNSDFRTAPPLVAARVAS